RSRCEVFPARRSSDLGSPVDGSNSNRTVRAECPVGAFENYQYDEDGLFESGYITLPGQGWRSASSGQATSFVPTGGMQQSLSRRDRQSTRLNSSHVKN